MSYNFKNLADVEMLTEVPESASVLAEVDGAIKRVPGDGLGGGGIKTAIIKDSNYDNALAGGVAAASAAPEVPEVTYSCINMTYEEACEILSNGEPLNVVLMTVTEGLTIVNCAIAFVPGLLIGLSIEAMGLILYWTSSGITAEMPK